MLDNITYEYPEEIREKGLTIFKYLNRQSALPGMEEDIKKFYNQKAYNIACYLVDRNHRMEKECYYCYDKQARDFISGYYYDTPFQDEGENRYFCSEECRDNYENGGDFRYFYCEFCSRMICEQNPSNGWHVQYRTLGEDGEQICLKCYEEYILENGIEREKFANNQIPGMFFSYGNTEAIDAGYEEVEGFTDYFVGDPKPFCKKAVKLIDAGYKVVVGYERMAIGGLEGTVTMFACLLPKQQVF